MLTTPTLWVTCGLPGAGKSTWAKAHASMTGAVMLSADAVRTMNERPGACFARMRMHTAQALSAGRSVVFDSCALRAHERLQAYRLGADACARCVLIVFCVPWRTCLERDRARGEDGTLMGDGEWYAKRGLMACALEDLRREPWDDVQYIPEQRVAAAFLWGSV